MRLGSRALFAVVVALPISACGVFLGLSDHEFDAGGAGGASSTKDTTSTLDAVSSTSQSGSSVVVAVSSSGSTGGGMGGGGHGGAPTLDGGPTTSAGGGPAATASTSVSGSGMVASSASVGAGGGGACSTDTDCKGMLPDCNVWSCVNKQCFLKPTSCIPCPQGICNGNYACMADLDHCKDGCVNDLETDVDCGGGGLCPKCAATAACVTDNDCASGLCDSNSNTCQDCDDVIYFCHGGLPCIMGVCS